MRKPNSIIDLVCQHINSLPIGSTYTPADIRGSSNFSLNYNNRYKIHGSRERVRSFERLCSRISYINIGLMKANIVKRVKNGVYQIICHVPDFFDQSTIEANNGRRTYPDNKLVGKPWKNTVNTIVPDEVKVPAEKPLEFEQFIDTNEQSEFLTFEMNYLSKFLNFKNLAPGFDGPEIEMFRIVEFLTPTIERILVPETAANQMLNCTKTLEEALQQVAYAQSTDVKDVINSMLDKYISENEKNITDSETEETPNQVKGFNPLDLLGHTVYYNSDPLNGFVIRKSTIKSYNIHFELNKEPEMTDVLLANGKSFATLKDSELFYDKDELTDHLINKVNELVNIL